MLWEEGEDASCSVVVLHSMGADVNDSLLSRLWILGLRSRQACRLCYFCGAASSPAPTSPPSRDVRMVPCCVRGEGLEASEST